MSFKQKLLTYYEELVGALGLIVDENGFIYEQTEEESTYLKKDGLSFRLPSEDALKEIIKVEKGVTVKQYHLFNPINENAMSTTQVDVDALISHLEKLMSNMFILSLTNFVELEKKSEVGTISSPFVTRVMNRLSENHSMGGRFKELVDKTTFKVILKLIELVKDEKFILRLKLKNGDKYSTVKLNVFSYLYDAIKDGSEEDAFGLKLRNKDRLLLLSFVEGVFQELVDNDGIWELKSKATIGSFLTILMESFTVVTERLYGFLSKDDRDHFVTEEELRKLTHRIKGFKGVGEEYSLPDSTSISRNTKPTESPYGKQEISHSQTKPVTKESPGQSEESPDELALRRMRQGNQPQPYNPPPMLSNGYPPQGNTAFYNPATMGYQPPQGNMPYIPMGNPPPPVNQQSNHATMNPATMGYQPPQGNMPYNPMGNQPQGNAAFYNPATMGYQPPQGNVPYNPMGNQDNQNPFYRDPNNRRYK